MYLWRQQQNKKNNELKMNNSEYLIEILTDLKENHHAIGIKADLEDEGISSEELLVLENISKAAELDLAVKIGGCGALKDMKEAYAAGAKSIAAPMIESSYALKKYINTINCVFNEQERNDTKFYINIETKCGLENLDEILGSEAIKYIDGIVFGRTDYTESMALNSYDVDSDIVFKQASYASKKIKELGKEFVIGGGVSPMSVSFFNRLGHSLDKYETRKIVFDSYAVRTGRAEEGIIKALKFEQLWIKSKGATNSSDSARIKVIESRIGSQNF